MTFATESGNVYELDGDLPRIRCISGDNASTARQGISGDWRDYVLLSGVQIGSPVTVVWRFENDVAKATMLAPVTSIN